MKRYFFVGIGGIGMSALAQYMHAHGHSVSGSDRDESPTVELLRSVGIEVTIGHAPLSEQPDVLVYSDAIPETAPERVSAQEYGVEQRSYFSLLGEVSASMKTVAVAGTHGKTTTTGMLTKILVVAGKEPTAIIGSIVRDFGSNCVLGTDDVFVVEACEYKNHLLHFTPDVLVITNIELDHTDFFTDLAHLQDTFKKAVARVKPGGVIVTNPAHPTIAPVLEGTSCTVVDYTTEDVGQISHIGGFNRENAQAARAAARVVFPDITDEVANNALYEFKGSWRRFEYKGETARGASVYETRLDDFFNYLATQNDLREVLWCVFDEAKEYKFAAQTTVIIKRNKWKQHVYRLLEVGNIHAWLLLTEFAKSERESNELDIAAGKADDLA
jgi:UDP-N-acetylmuramate--alanine ligase